MNIDSDLQGNLLAAIKPGELPDTAQTLWIGANLIVTMDAVALPDSLSYLYVRAARATISCSLWSYDFVSSCVWLSYRSVAQNAIKTLSSVQFPSGLKGL